MNGMEKVTKGLESLRDICNAKFNMSIGNGKITWAGYANVAEDAIALLKEQQKQLEKYHEADTFLEAHGWKWEG